MSAVNSPAIAGLFRATLSAFSSISGRSTTTTWVSVSPICCRTFRRWWPPTTRPVRRFQTTGSTRPKRSTLAAKAGQGLGADLRGGCRAPAGGLGFVCLRGGALYMA